MNVLYDVGIYTLFSIFFVTFLLSYPYFLESRIYVRPCAGPDSSTTGRILHCSQTTSERWAFIHKNVKHS